MRIACLLAAAGLVAVGMFVPSGAAHAAKAKKGIRGTFGGAAVKIKPKDVSLVFDTEARDLIGGGTDGEGASVSLYAAYATDVTAPGTTFPQTLGSTAGSDVFTFIYMSPEGEEWVPDPTLPFTFSLTKVKRSTFTGTFSGTLAHYDTETATTDPGRTIEVTKGTFSVKVFVLVW